MPFEPVPVTTEDLTTYLTDNHGESVGVPELLGAADHFNCSLATVKKRLKGHKAGIGKWNLTIQEKLEKNFQAPSALPAVEQNLIPQKMIPSSSLVTLTIFAKLFSPESFIPRSLRVFRVTVKRSPLNKLVQRWVGNSSASTSQ